MKFQSYLAGLAVTFSLCATSQKSYTFVSSSPSQLGFLCKAINVIGLELLASGILLLQSPKELGFQAGTTLRPREINQLAEGHELLAGRSKWRSVSHRS